VSTVAAPQAPLRPAVVVLGACAGLASGAALLGTILLGWSLGLATAFIGVPALVALGALTVTARRDEQQLFLARIRNGFLAGVLATAAYDTVRLSLEHFGLAVGKSFVAIPLFGTALTGLPPTDRIAIATGFAFHTVNGVGFATAYVLVAAGRPWFLGIVFALFLEAMMVSLYPGWLRVPLTSEFLALSVSGHLAYGTVLGVVARATR
jgi:hypothetical protein